MKGRFEGIIQKVNEPKYSEKYGVWSISLKENGKWTSVWRKDPVIKTDGANGIKNRLVIYNLLKKRFSLLNKLDLINTPLD